MAVDSSLPYRFKAGTTNMQSEAFHHRRASSLSHKPFKSRHATKSYLKEVAKGKTASILRNYGKGERKTPYQQVMSKLQRRHRAKQQLQNKAQQNAKLTSVFSGLNGAPRIVALIPLSSTVDLHRAIAKLNEAANAEAQFPVQGSSFTVRVDRFKQNVMYVPVDEGDLFASLNACQVADFVVLVMSAKDAELPGDQYEMILKAIESQGVSNVISLVQDVNAVEQVKKRAQIIYGLKLWITRYFPQQENVLNLDSDSECANVVRSLCTTTPKGINWRERRSWMISEDVRWLDQPSTGTGETMKNVVVTGVVRGKGLKANRLFQLGDWGHFQIEKITNAALPSGRKRKPEDAPVDTAGPAEDILEKPDGEQDSMDRLAPYEAPMGDAEDDPLETLSEKKGVLIDDHHYYSEDEADEAHQKPKRLPKGTSNYQAAWFLGDMSDNSDSDYEDNVDEEGDLAMESVTQPQDGTDGLDMKHLPEATETQSEFPESEMFLDPSPAQEATEIEQYRASRKTEAEADAEFPDEIELRPNVLARERLAKYRGLKSLKTSPWNSQEDRAHEPDDWTRLLQIPDYKRASNQFLNDALVGGVQPGSRVSIELRSVPPGLQQRYTHERPLPCFSLLQHEQKHTVIHVSLTLSSSHPKPLKSKDELLIQYGPRRLIIKPIFSQLGNTPNDVHKFQRYLHPSQTAVASFIGPVTWGAVPALFFLPSTVTNADTYTPIGTGTLFPPSPSRVIVKRAILTGHPYKIHKKVVTVRYMFFNREDVLWFKALQLWTRRGRSGFVKESLGTHGYFKATFDAKINPQDAVGVSLYKRMWPRPARAWTAPARDRARDAEDAMDVQS